MSKIVEEIKKDALIIEDKVKEEVTLIKSKAVDVEIAVKQEYEVIKEAISHSCAITLKNGVTIWTKIHNKEEDLLAEIKSIKEKFKDHL